MGRNMRDVIKFAMTVLLFTCSTSVFADLSNNRSDFLNSIPGSLTVTTIDFEGFAFSPPSISFNLPNGPGFSSYGPTDPVSPGNQLFTAAGLNSAPSIILLATGGDVYSYLPGGTFAVGADFGAKFPNGGPIPTFTFRAFNWNFDVIESLVFTPDEINSTFIGVTSLSDIRMISVTSDDPNAGVALDNFTFAHTVASVPEPTSILLGCTAFSAFALRRRIRKTLPRS